MESTVEHYIHSKILIKTNLQKINKATVNFLEQLRLRYSNFQNSEILGVAYI